MIHLTTVIDELKRTDEHLSHANAENFGYAVNLARNAIGRVIRELEHIRDVQTCRIDLVITGTSKAIYRDGSLVFHDGVIFAADLITKIKEAYDYAHFHAWMIGPPDYGMPDLKEWPKTFTELDMTYKPQPCKPSA